MNLLEELKRRNVFRVGIAYAIVAWLSLQVADLVLENINAPEWVMQTFMLAVGIGLPLALILAWAFELTPEGIKRESEVDRSESLTPQTGKRLDRLIIGVMGAVIVFLLVDRFFLQNRAEPAPAGQPTPADTESAKSIAVLPFADLSQSGDQEWFADGLAEEILNALARAPDLLVASRTSAFRYKNSDLDISQIGKELGVAHVLEGSVRRSDERLRVTAQLVRTGDGFHVWSENYDRDVEDMITIQEDLARSIAEALETTMDPAALAEMTRAGTRSVQAYEQYLRGIDRRLTRDDGLEQAAINDRAAYEHFEAARRIDPGFSRAHLQAAAYWQIQLTPTRFGFGSTELSVAERFTAFSERIEQAIEQAASEADRTLYQAFKAEMQLRLNEALRLYQDYLAERPNDLDAIGNFLSVANRLSQPEAATAALETIRERVMNEYGAAVAYINHAYRILGPEAAADAVAALAERYSDQPPIQYQAHRSLLWAGRHAEAKRSYERFMQLVPGGDPVLQARQACADGDRARAEALLAQVDASRGAARSEAWQILKLLGRDHEATERLRAFEVPGSPQLLVSWLTYAQFDPRPFPSLMALLAREGIDRPPPQEIPFKCPPPEEASIAVLPFVNMSADAENEFFSDGISEEILNVLARIPELKVAARTSAFAFKGSKATVAAIASELGVNHVLEGSVRKAGDQVRITAQLIKAKDGFHLWSGNFDRRLDNVFAIQDEIAQSIAETMKLELGLKAGAAGNLTGTNSIPAYEAYLKGMSLWHQRTLASLNGAIEAFNQAISLDPRFAKAHAGLAMTWAVLPGYTPTAPETAHAMVESSTDAALRLDPDNAEALAARALMARSQGRIDESRADFQQAIRLNPSFATAHQWYASYKAGLGDSRGALETMQKARDLDPRSRIIGYNLAWRLMSVNRLDDAMAVTSEVIAMAPEFNETIGQLMLLKLIAGECDAVQGLGNRLAKLLRKQVNSTPVYVKLCRRDDPAARREALGTLLDWGFFDYANPAHPTLSYGYQIGFVLIELGEFDTLFEFMETASGNSREAVAELRSWDTENGRKLRCDPRFHALERALDLPPAERPAACPR